MKTRSGLFKTGMLAGVAALSMYGVMGTAQAGIILVSGAGSGTAGFTTAPTTNTPNPGNDNTISASPNTVSFATTLTANQGFINSQFMVFNSGGTTEYFFTNTVTNNSGGPVGVYFYNLFVTPLSATPAGLDFDSPSYDPAPTSSPFPTVATSPQQLVFSGAGIPATIGSQTTFNFSVDVPDTLVGSSYTFTLQQIPNPEPGTWAMMAIGLVGLGAAGWRKKKQDASASDSTDLV